MIARNMIHYLAIIRKHNIYYSSRCNQIYKITDLPKPSSFVVSIALSDYIIFVLNLVVLEIRAIYELV